MIQTKRLILSITMILGGFAAQLSAAEYELIAPKRGWSLDLTSSQQEAYGSSIEVYSPGFGQWGQFGIVFGSKNYYWTDAQNKQKLMPNGEIALAWKLGEITVGRFAPLAILQLGQSSYKTGTVEDSQDKSHIFFTLEFDAEYRLILMNSNIINALSVAIGIGSRSNFFGSGERDAGHYRIAPSVLYPAFRVSVEF